MTTEDARARFGRLVDEAAKTCNVRTVDQIDMGLRLGIASLIACSKAEIPDTQLREVLHKSVDRIFFGMIGKVRRGAEPALILPMPEPTPKEGRDEITMEVAETIGDDLEELTAALEHMVFPDRGPEYDLVDDPGRDAIRDALVLLFRDHRKAAQGVINGMAPIEPGSPPIERIMN